MYRGTGVSCGVRRTTWDRSLKHWELQIPCFEEFFWGGNTLGLVPASLPRTLGYACTFYAPTSPPPTLRAAVGPRDRCGKMHSHLTVFLRCLVRHWPNQMVYQTLQSKSRWVDDPRPSIMHIYHRQLRWLRGKDFRHIVVHGN